MNKFSRSEMLLALAALFGLNLWDAVATLVALHAGGVELNPAMAHLQQYGPWAFLGFKVILVGLVCLVLWHGRKSTWTPKALVLCIGLYSAVGMHHVGLFLSGGVAYLARSLFF